MDSDYIYHYTKFENAIESILPNRQLLFNKLTNTNDPREYKSFIFAAEYWNNNTQDIEAQNEINSTILRSDCKVICFSRMRTPFFGYEHSSMWAHYAGLHRGICLRINKKEFLTENKLIIKPKLFKNIRYIDFNINKMPDHKQVKYPKDYEQLEGYLKGEFRNKYLDFLYFRKTKEWSTERETRLVYFSDSNENEFCSIKNSLSAIYLGLRFNQHYLPSVFKLTNQIPVFEFRYSDDRLIPIEVKKSI
jgi:hypothetical protein